MDGLALSRDQAALLIIDVQARLCAAMGDDRVARLTRNVGILLEAARRMKMPIVVTQQYPRGLGPTVAPLEQALAEVMAGQLHRFDKMEFSACDAAAFAPLDEQLGPRQWIVAGMESHVCVYQTARGLAARSASVHVVADAVLSRTGDNTARGLALCERAGAIVTSTETVVFDLLGCAGGDDFKHLSRLIR